MNGTKVFYIVIKAEQKSSVVDASRFVFAGPDPVTPQQRAPEVSQPMISSQPSPDAFMPRPARPFPISSQDENPKRGNWWNKIEFIFACIAVCVGETSIFTLPNKVFINGGGIFFILYALGMIFIMFPYIVLEMALGQFSSSGIISMWNFSPLLKGFGVLATLYLALINVERNIFSAYHLFYAYITVKYSVSSETLPWLDCSHSWNTDSCFDSVSQGNILPVNFTMGSSVPGSVWQDVSYVYPDMPERVQPAAEYFNAFVGNTQDADLTNIGSLKPALVFGLLATWGFILALTCLGAKWTGKVAYFILPVTVILLFVLLIRGATLPGAIDGLKFYLFFDWSALLSFTTWMDAFSSVFYTGFFGAGVFSTLSSYNKFHNNFCLDAFFIMGAVTIINLMVVLLVAAYAGFFSFYTETPIHEFTGAGVDLSLQIMPRVLGAIPSAYAWTCVFFITLFLLCIGSSIYMVQALLTTLLDLFHLPHSFIFLLPTSGIICVLSFLISLPMVTEGGYGLLFTLDSYTAFWAAPVVTIVLLLASIWIYGTIPKWDIMRLPREIQKMVGFFPQPIQFIFLPFWAVIIPLCTVVFLLYQLIQVPFFLETRPNWMRYVLFALGIVPVLLIPIFVAVYQLCKRRRGYTFLTQLFWNAAKSSEDWGPPVEHHRLQVGYSRHAESNNPPHQLNSEIHYNPATALHMPQDVTTVVYPQAQLYSPPPPAYNEYHQPGQTSPSSAKNLSPTPSSVGSGLPTMYPSPLVGAGPPASPATVSATDTVESNRLYPPTSLDDATGAETDLGLSEPEDSAFVNASSHETTL